jgi:sulfite reductase alpha subunit-like flavoprotein
MPTAVRKAVEYALQQEGGYSEDDAKAYVKGMEDGGRWWEECWS